MDNDNLKPTELIYADELQVGDTLIQITGGDAQADLRPVEVQRVRKDATHGLVSAIVLDKDGIQSAVQRDVLDILRILKRS